MFRTNNYSSSGGWNHIVLAARHPQMHDTVLHAACTEITW